MVARLSLEERFFAKVTKTDACWIWTGAKYAHGYGCFRIDGNKRIGAHRYSYLIHNGEIPDGMLICHTCDNTSCVNPDHLWVGTHRQNTLDMIKKGRSMFRGAKTIKEMCVHGHQKTPENTYVVKSKNGYTYRHCKICKKEQRRKK